MALFKVGDIIKINLSSNEVSILEHNKDWIRLKALFKKGSDYIHNVFFIPNLDVQSRMFKHEPKLDTILSYRFEILHIYLKVRSNTVKTVAVRSNNINARHYELCCIPVVKSPNDLQPYFFLPLNICGHDEG